LRSTYKNFYARKPAGLNGALNDVGISFEGREHSGVCDARNTAKLAYRMIQDGCIMTITKSIGPTGPTTRFPPTIQPPVSGQPQKDNCASKDQPSIGSGENTDTGVIRKSATVSTQALKPNTSKRDDKNSDTVTCLTDGLRRMSTDYKQKCKPVFVVPPVLVEGRNSAS